MENNTYNRLFPEKVSTNSLVCIYVLHVLNKNKMYGKELIQTISDRFNGHWNLSHGLIYPMLRDLENEGLLRGEWVGDTTKRTMRVYEITTKGKRAYVKEKEAHKHLFAQSFQIMETAMMDLYEDYQPVEWFIEEDTKEETTPVV